MGVGGCRPSPTAVRTSSECLSASTPHDNRSELETPNMQNCSRRSKLELRGPRSGLKPDPRSSRGVRSAPFSR
eukprot:5829939-Alexandrium_andersonii.AAC.1